MSRILIGTPTIDFKVGTGYLNTILGLNALTASKGHQFPVFTLNGNSSINDARNQIASVFLDSPFDYLFFLDSDVELRAEDVDKALAADKDIIGIPVLRKNYENPTLNIGNILSEPVNGIVEVDGISTSALIIKREVLEAFKDCETYTNKNVINNSSFNVPVFYNIFTSGVVDGNYHHEDYMFCLHAIKKGFKIHALLDCVTVHNGNIPYVYRPQAVSKPANDEAKTTESILG
jgi:hypothetical protein